MKTINVFIASSSELKPERLELVDLMLDLNDLFEEKLIRFKSEMWEFYDSSMGEKHKEDEYLEKLRLCDICIVLFWRTLGEYTVEELNVAEKEMKLGRKPQKVYILFKESADNISEKLMVFKRGVNREYQDIPVLFFTDLNNLRQKVTQILLGF